MNQGADFPGAGYRERERVKRKAERWARRLAALPESERVAVLSFLANIFPALPEHKTLPQRGGIFTWRRAPVACYVRVVSMRSKK